MPFSDDSTGVLRVPGPFGASAYDAWLGEGNVGTIADFLESARGRPGRDGLDGGNGAPGRGIAAAAVGGDGFLSLTFDDGDVRRVGFVRGPQGAGVQIRGSVASPVALPTNGSSGDTYIVTGSGSGYASGDGYTYTGSGTDQGTNGNWRNVGPLRGPVGPQGPDGKAGGTGARGPQGNPTSVNGKSGASITLTGSSIPLNEVANAPTVEAVIGAKLDKAGGTLTGGVNIAPGNQKLPTQLALDEPTHPTSRRVSFNIGPWQLGSDLEGDGRRGFYLYGFASQSTPFRVTPDGQNLEFYSVVSYKARSEKLPLSFNCEESKHATSRRVTGQFGRWQIGQDLLGDGTRNFFLFGFEEAGHVLTVSEKGETTFHKPLHLSEQITASIEATSARPVIDLFTADRNRTAEGGADAFQIGAAHVHHTVNPVGHRERAHTETHSYGAAASKFIVDMTSIAWGHTGSGSLFAMNGVTIIEPEMAASTEASAAEFNTVVKRDVLRKTGIQIVDAPGSGGKGTAIDAGLLIGKAGGSFGYGHGFQIGDANDAGLYPTRTAILYSGVGTTEKGFDLRSTTLTSGHAVILRSGTRVSWAPDGNTAPTGGSIRSDANANGPNLVLASNILAVQTDNGSAFATFNIAGSSLQPGGDGTIALGAPSLRWSQVYAATGAINTSDERLKQDIAEPDDAALDAIGEVGPHLFRFIASAQEKGDDARIHAGVIAQHIRGGFIRHGLDPARYALFCEDPVMEPVEVAESVEEPETRQETYEATELTFRDDGTAVERIVARTREVPVLDEVPVFDVDGLPVILPAAPERVSKHKREDGTIEIVVVSPALPERPKIVSRPRMRTVEHIRIVERQKAAPDGTPLTILGVRYTELLVLWHAWTRRELARLAERLPKAA